MAKIKPGYRGIALLDGTKVRCSSFSVNPSQNVLFYNHVMGLHDKADYNTADTKGVDEELINTQRRIWRPGVITVQGGISFPATSTSLSSLFNIAKKSQEISSLRYRYYCNEGGSGGERKFTGGRVNGYTLSAVAGEVVNITMDLVFKKIEEDEGGDIHYKDPEKIITWDKVSLTFSNLPFSLDNTIIQGFEFKINNNIAPIYVSGDSGNSNDFLYPYDLRTGMQEVSGSITVYLDQGQEVISMTQSSPSIINVTIGDFTFSLKTVFETSQMDGQVGPIMTQIPFVGVDKVFE